MSVSLPQVAARLAPALDPVQWNFNAPVNQSMFVDFFHNWPRYGRSNAISFTRPYILTTFLVATPWVIVAVLCALFASVVNICYGGVRRRGAKNYEDSDLDSSSSDEDESVSRAQLLGGVVLVNGAMLLLALSFVAAYHFYEGSQSVMDLAETNGVDVSRNAVAIIDVVRRVLSAFSSIAPTATQAQLFPDRSPVELLADLDEASKQFSTTAFNIELLSGYLWRFGTIAFYLVVAVYLVLLTGFLLLFSTAFPKRSHQRFAMALYVVPFVFGWLSVAIITASSTVAGDLCVALSDFQRIVLVQSGVAGPALSSGINSTQNIFIGYNIQCPAQLVGGNIQFGSATSVLSQALGSDLFSTAIFSQLYPKATASQRNDLRNWLTPSVRDLISCSLITRLAAKFNYTFCGERGPMLALFIGWVSLLVLAVLLTISYLLTQFTKFEVSRFTTPYIRLDQDLYEAFSGVYDGEHAGKDTRVSQASAQQEKRPSTVVPVPPPTSPVFLMPGEKAPVAEPSAPPSPPPIAPRSIALIAEDVAPVPPLVVPTESGIAAVATSQQKRRGKKLFGRRSAAVASDANPSETLPTPPAVISATPVAKSGKKRTSKRDAQAPPAPPPVINQPVSAAPVTTAAPPPPPPMAAPKQYSKPAAASAKAPPPPPPMPGLKQYSKPSGSKAPPPPPPPSAKPRGKAPAPPPVVEPKRGAPPPPPPVIATKVAPAPPPPMPSLKQYSKPTGSKAPPPPPPPPPPPGRR